MRFPRSSCVVATFGPGTSFLGVRSHELMAPESCKICNILLPGTMFAYSGRLTEVRGGLRSRNNIGGDLGNFCAAQTPPGNSTFRGTMQ